MTEAGAFTGLNDPYLLFRRGSQMFDCKALGDHSLAVGIGPNQHQALRPQRRWSRQQIRQPAMGVLRNLVRDPSRGADICNSLGGISVEIQPDMIKQMIRHAELPILHRQPALLAHGVLRGTRHWWLHCLIRLCRCGGVRAAHGIAQLAL